MKAEGALGSDGGIIDFTGSDFGATGGIIDLTGSVLTASGVAGALVSVLGMIDFCGTSAFVNFEGVLPKRNAVSLPPFVSSFFDSASGSFKVDCGMIDLGASSLAAHSFLDTISFPLTLSPRILSISSSSAITPIT